jgi:putative DNA primase/helicase
VGATVTPFELVLSRLEGIHRIGDGKAEARCPSHDDKRASLSVKVGADGRALLYCHAGCELKAIAAAAKLEIAELFPEQRTPVAITVAPRRVATYDYTDEAGALLSQVERLEPKGFRQRRPDGNGGWVWGLGDVRRVLYRLPQVVADKGKRVVFIVEGEKDADALARLGLLATCNPGGVGMGWRRSTPRASRAPAWSLSSPTGTSPAGNMPTRWLAL